MRTVREEVVLKIENVLSTINKHIDERPYLNELREKLNSRLDELRRLREVKAINRRYVEALLDVYYRVKDFEKLISLYLEGKSVYDEIYVAHIELDESISRLIDVAKSASFRERILNVLPIVTVLTYCIFDTVYSLAITGLNLHSVALSMHLTTISLAAVSMYIIHRNQVVSYTLLVVSGLIGLLNKTYVYTTYGLPFGFDIAIYASIVFMSMIYLNTARIMVSKEYREKVENMVRSLLSLVSSSRESSMTERDETDALWIRAVELFKTLYGERGEDLLRFKVETMVMNGLNRNDALKKIIDIYEKILSKH